MPAPQLVLRLDAWPIQRPFDQFKERLAIYAADIALSRQKAIVETGSEKIWITGGKTFDHSFAL